MPRTEKRQFREHLRQVRELFMREWDLLGAQDEPPAADEYDAYADKAYVMLMYEKASADDIERYLMKIADEYMGVGLAPWAQERCRATSRALYAMKAVFTKESQSS